MLKRFTNVDFRVMLPIRFTLFVALPIFLIMSLLAFMHYWRTQRVMETQMVQMSQQLSELLIGGLQHAMLINNQEMIQDILVDAGKTENIAQIQIIDLNNKVKVDSLGRDTGKIMDTSDSGCNECHQHSPETRLNATKLIDSPHLMRTVTPIFNEPECTACHSEDDNILGIILTDVSLEDVEDDLFINLQTELFILLGIMFAVTLGIELIHFRGLRRRMAVREPLARLATGDFSTRMTSSSGPIYDMDRYAQTLNVLAEELEEKAREQEKFHQFREQAIVEERERIARELHDGIAQLLGYVNTKVMAVRLLLKKEKLEAADQNLLQLEEATRGLFVSVREAILGLKIANQYKVEFVTILQEYVVQFTRLSGLAVDLTFDPTITSISFSDETKLQLLRIIQEALTNARKHAMSSNLWVDLQVTDTTLGVKIRDDGQGFGLQGLKDQDWQHFGLDTMRERANDIGANFEIISIPGEGTEVVVNLPLNPEK